MHKLVYKDMGICQNTEADSAHQANAPVEDLQLLAVLRGKARVMDHREARSTDKQGRPMDTMLTL